MTTGKDIDGRGLFEATHRIEPLFQMPVVALDPVVQVFRRPMFDVREHLTDRRWVARCLVGRHALRFDSRVFDSTREEGVGCLRIAPLRNIGIDHLAILVDRPVEVGPATLQADIPCIDAPPIAEWSAIGAGGFPKQREQALDPALDGAAIHHEPAFSEPRDDVGVAEAIAHVPPHSYGDHIIREGMVRKGARRARGASADRRCYIATVDHRAACVHLVASARFRIEYTARPTPFNVMRDWSWSLPTWLQQNPIPLGGHNSP